MSHKNITVQQEDSGERLDKYLTANLPEFSRSRVQQLIAKGLIKLKDAVITDSNRKIKVGEQYEIAILPPESSEIKANPIELNIIFEDEHLLVIDKPAGMTVHPAPGHTNDTLVNALLAHCAETLSGIGGVMRPGIVHRIDKDTSGLLVVAKHDIVHRHLSAQLAERTLKRQYIAIVKGIPKPIAGKIEGNIARSNTNRKKMAIVKSGGKEAVTHYKVEEIFEHSALVQCNLETGRTHQIRVHMAHLGYPLIGDQVYGRKGKVYNFPRQALHAAKLTLIHPITGKTMEFLSPMPNDMEELVKSLRGT